MRALVRSLAAALLFGVASTAWAQGPAASVSIIQAENPSELQQKFCAADPTVEHIVILPASLFVDSEQVNCAVGPYKLYRIIEHDDPDDFEYFVDSPYGTTGRLACDGKAGLRMTVVAVNCRPV